jgi:hypothetical protein
MQCFPGYCYFFPPWPKYLSQHPILKHAHFPKVTDSVSHPYKTDRIVVLCILIVLFLYSKRENKDSEPNGSKYSLTLIGP